MDAKAELQGSRTDTLKLISALLIIILAIASFYYYADQSLLVRVIGLLGAAGIAVAIGFRTEQGRQLWGFLRDAQVEVHKVVWPTREETVKATLLVVLMVVVVAIFLWFLGLLLGWLARMLTG
jgi:preprotein translocase subunit SecE